MNLKNKSPG